MNVWALLIVVVLCVFAFSVLLLRVRVKDIRADAIFKAQVADQAGREAVAVLQSKEQTEIARFEYGRQQAAFAMRVLDMFELGKWGGGEEELRAAIIRQLDGVRPPRGAPDIAIRTQPMAQWPDGTPYNEVRRM